MRASISTDGRAAVTAGTTYAAYLLKISFSGGAILCCTGSRKITYNAEVYSPNGLWLGASGIEERKGKAPAVNLVMSASGTMKTRVEAGGYRRTAVEINQAIMDDDWTIIDTFPMGSYRISKIAAQLSKDSYVYDVACSSDIDDAYRAHPVYPSNTMQQLRYADDTYFVGASAIKGYELEWGSRSYQMFGGASCVFVDERIDGKRAGDIRVGDVLRIADPDTLAAGEAEVLYSGLSLQPGVKITTETGRTLTCSASAPVATDSGLVRAKHLMHYAAVIEGGSYEDVVRVESLGDILVQHIYVGEQCFWVNGFLHHNKTLNLPMQAESIETGRSFPSTPSRTFRAI